MEKQRIPADFLIGTSSSAWQIEGCAGKKEGQESWAELFYDTNPDIWYDDVGPKKASDFYHHYKEDIKTMASFGMTGFRFTIQWARFMKDPIAGIVDYDAVEYYRDVIHEIKKNGMEPVISLEHWDIPAILFEKYNGWVGRETVYLYEQYVKAVLKEFHKEVKLWFAFTEPNIPIDKAIWMESGIHLNTHQKKHIRHIFIRSLLRQKQLKRWNHTKKMDADLELCYI